MFIAIESDPSRRGVTGGRHPVLGGAPSGDPAAFEPTFLKTLREVDPTVGSALLSDLRSYVNAAIAPRRFSVGLLADVHHDRALAHDARRLRGRGLRRGAAAPRDRSPHGSRCDPIRHRPTDARLAPCDSPRIGVVVGLVGARLAGGLMSHLMFGVSPGSPALLAVVSGILLVTALVASWVPGRRAARIDVLRALAAELSQKEIGSRG